MFPCQSNRSVHFTFTNMMKILSEICPLQVLLINLHFRECKGFIWKKKRKEEKGDNKRRNRVLWSPLFFRWLQIHTYIHTLLRLPSTGLFSHNVNYVILVIKKRKKNLFTVVQLNSKYVQNYSIPLDPENKMPFVPLIVYIGGPKNCYIPLCSCCELLNVW